MTAVQRWLLRRAEARPDPVLAAHLAELLAGVAGRVVEIGCGRGKLFPRYPESVTELIAVEPDPRSRAHAEPVAAAQRFPIRVLDGRAEALPVDTGWADVVVCCEVLCSVADPAAVLAEARRVLREGGELRVYEHVLASNRPGRLVQRAVDLAGWPRLLGGCHTARDTVNAVRHSGFRWRGQQRVWQASIPLTWPSGPHVLGSADRGASNSAISTSV